MVIADSSIQMNSTRIFNQFSSQAVASGLLTNSRFLSDLKGAFDSSKKDTLELSGSMDTGTDLTYDVSAGSRSSRTDNSSLISKRVEELHQIRIQLLQQILGLMQNMSGKKNNFLDKASSALSDLMTMGSGYTSVTTMESYYEETEMTTFEAQGIAHTADGREINFGVSVSMSRKYTEYTSMQVARDIPLLDPLVIIGVIDEGLGVLGNALACDSDVASALLKHERGNLEYHHPDSLGYVVCAPPCRVGDLDLRCVGPHPLVEAEVVVADGIS